MKFFLLLTLLAAVPLFSQSARPDTPPDAVVAVVDGRKLTAREVEVILRAVAPAQKQQAMRSPKEFLEQYGLLRRLSAMAEKEGLDRQSPLKEQLEYNRMVQLAQAQLLKSSNEIPVTDEELRKQYESTRSRFEQARVKAIYIPFSAHPPAQPGPDGKKLLTEDEAKAKAEELVAQIRGGADFVKLVKEHSGDPASAAKDGDFGLIRQSDPLPAPIKMAIFALEPGKISDPIRQPNGFYIFRVEERIIEPFDKVKSQLTSDVTQLKMNEMVSKMRGQIEITIEDSAFFTAEKQ